LSTSWVPGFATTELAVTDAPSTSSCAPEPLSDPRGRESTETLDVTVTFSLGPAVITTWSPGPGTVPELHLVGSSNERSSRCTHGTVANSRRSSSDSTRWTIEREREFDMFEPPAESRHAPHSRTTPLVPAFKFAKRVCGIYGNDDCQNAYHHQHDNDDD